MGSGATQLVPVASGTLGMLQVSKVVPDSEPEPPQPLRLSKLIEMANKGRLLVRVNIRLYSIIIFIKHGYSVVPCIYMRFRLQRVRHAQKYLATKVLNGPRLGFTAEVTFGWLVGQVIHLKQHAEILVDVVRRLIINHCF